MTFKREATERLSRRHQHKAYTALRELVGRRSLIGERELLDYLIENGLTPLQGMITDTFFDPVPEVWLIEGVAHRCAHCRTLMRSHPNKRLYPDGRCPVRQCNHRNSPKVSKRLNPAQDRLLVAKPQILTYWTGPAIDELAIFDAARQKGLNAELYPESDLCDIAINDRLIGIDAKSYTSPVSLALRLNRGIGGLIHYRRRILHHYCNKTKGTYEIDPETLRFKRTDPLEDPLIDKARRILGAPLPYQANTTPIARSTKANGCVPR